MTTEPVCVSAAPVWERKQPSRRVRRWHVTNEGSSLERHCGAHFYNQQSPCAHYCKRPSVTCDVHLSLYRGGIGRARGPASSGWLSLRVWLQWGDPESRGRAAIFPRLFAYLILPWNMHRGCIAPNT